MSIIWEGMKAQPTFSLPWPVFCEILHCSQFLRSCLSERGPVVRIVGIDTGCSMAWLPIIPFPFHMCQVLIAKLQSLSQGHAVFQVNTDKGQGCFRLSGETSADRRNVGVTCPAHQPNHRVAQGCHDLWDMATSHLGAVLIKGHIPDQCDWCSLCHWPRVKASKRATSAHSSTGLVTPTTTSSWTSPGFLMMIWRAS